MPRFRTHIRESAPVGHASGSSQAGIASRFSTGFARDLFFAPKCEIAAPAAGFRASQSQKNAEKRQNPRFFGL
jgi:hypothetical protein